MRAEFSKPTKRLALQRSEKRCEAVGELYGLPVNHRCNADLSLGVQFDHLILAANGGDASLDNCVAVCLRCHSYKTRTHDTPLAAKTLRQQDKAHGIRRKSRPLPGTRASGIRKRMNGAVERW